MVLGYALWVLIATLATLLGAAPAFKAGVPSVFKMGVEQDGVYRVRFEDLGAGGWRPSTRSLALTNRGVPVPIWVEDGGDGTFGPGDHLEFVGQHLAGTRSYWNEYSRDNVYWLSAFQPMARRFRDGLLQPAAPSQPPAFTRRHLEQDRLRVRFRDTDAAPSPEVWYWARLSQIDPRPFTLDVDLGRPGGRDASVMLRVGLRGWSTLAAPALHGLHGHRAEILLNEQLVGAGEWDGQDEQVVQVAVPASTLTEGTDRLAIRVPQRRPSATSDPLIDVVLLNWIEVTRPVDEGLQNGQAAIDPTPSGARLALTHGEGLVFTAGGRRLPLADATRPVGIDPGPAYLVAGEGFLKPAWIVADARATLPDAEVEAEYVMIAHRTLLKAVAPLAEFHRARGLTVSVVDVDDVYDAFNHGIESPEAIRAFIDHAYHRWNEHKLRFVLLVGDASWDVHNERPNDRYYADWTYRRGESGGFVKNGSTPYREQVTRRNLVPTWEVETDEGLAASDNAFVTVNGVDWYPDLAIGRLPVVRPAEVTAIVDKVVAYAERSEVGPWRRNVLLIANEDRGLQAVSDSIDRGLGAEGFEARKVYPSPDEPDNAANQASILEAFGEGQVLVHFLGHGGRYIWRTGPPDYRKNHDLFTLEDVERLPPTSKLPLILSMTCYSAPFDHPTADSIGEGFLRLPERGAIGVLAASWRNDPTGTFSHFLMKELTVPGSTIGEAIMRAKQGLLRRVDVETYNLLGDPALELAIPGHRLALSASRSAKGVTVSGRLEGADVDGGRLIVDWYDAAGRAMRVQEQAVQSKRFSIEYPLSLGEPPPASARAYFWNADARIDGVGTVVLSGSH
jgi:hypothetical protein